MNDQEQRREQILRASANRRAQASAGIPAAELPTVPVSTMSAPEPAAPPPRRQQPEVWSPAKDIEIRVVPKGTRPNPAAMRGARPGAQVVDAGRPAPRPTGNVVPVHGRNGSTIRASTGGRSGGVHPVRAVTTQSAAGVQATTFVPVPPPSVQPTGAPVVDLTLVLAVHARPALIEPQQRLLMTQTVQPLARAAWQNPTDRARFTPQVQAMLAKIPGLVTPNVDMGPWMRWGIASQCRTEFVAILDDDCMPGPRWFELALQRLQSAGEHDIIACGGLLYGSDRADDMRPVGPEAPPVEEVEVDIGRGGWMMRADTARRIATTVPVVDLLSTGLHVSAVVQELGGLVIVLPYGRDHATWGMLEGPKSDNSMTARINEEHRNGQAPGDASSLRADLYSAYRQQGWTPWCVLLADSAAAADTVRLNQEEFAT
jgi:hypothetical protein